MKAVSAEPNVRPIKVYWDQVVLVSLKVAARLTKHGAEYDGTGGNGGRLERLDLTPSPPSSSLVAAVVVVVGGGGDVGVR